MTQEILQTITIKAPAYRVWDTLTRTDLMQQWMGDPDMHIEVITDWKVGSPIVIKGFHHVAFENKGTVLHYDPNKMLQYNYLSSVSRLADLPEHYTIIAFTLSPEENQTKVTLTLSNFPTEAIFKHVGFYWRTTIHIMKKLAEQFA